MLPAPRINGEDKTCVTCGYFGFDPVTPRLNRECLYKGKIRTEGGKCACWKDPRTFTEKLAGKRIRVKAFTQ